MSGSRAGWYPRLPNMPAAIRRASGSRAPTRTPRRPSQSRALNSENTTDKETSLRAVELAAPPCGSRIAAADSCDRSLCGCRGADHLRFSATKRLAVPILREGFQDDCGSSIADLAKGLCNPPPYFPILVLHQQLDERPNAAPVTRAGERGRRVDLQ